MKIDAFLIDLMVSYKADNFLVDLLYSTSAKKPNETNRTVALLQICVERLQELQNCHVPLYFTNNE